MNVVEFDGRYECFAESYFRFTHNDRAVVLAFHALRINLEVKFTHSRSDRFFIIVIELYL